MADEGLGSLAGGLQDPEMEETKPPSTPQLVPVKKQPCNQATMVCLRGPCIYLWRLLLRFDSAVKAVMTERTLTCLASPSEEFELNDRLVYFCDRWWPRAPLFNDDGEVFSPTDELHAKGAFESQSAIRPELHEAWEEGLRQLGYDFSWRNFDPELRLSSDDDSHQRRFSAPGGYEAAREALQPDDDLPPAGSIPEDDPPPVKTPEEEEAEAEAEYIHQMLLKQAEEDAE